MIRPALGGLPRRGRRTGCARPRPNPSARGRSCAGRSAPARRESRRPAITLRATRAGGDARGGLARRGAAAAAIVAHAVLGEIGVVGVAGAELSARSRRSPCERWSTFSIISEIGVPVVTCPPVRSSSNTPERMRTASGSLPLGDEARLAGPALVETRPGCRPRQAACRGGQPSTTQPSAGPWLSPQVVTRNRWPKVLCDMPGPRVFRACAFVGRQAGRVKPPGLEARPRGNCGKIISLDNKVADQAAIRCEPGVKNRPRRARPRRESSKAEPRVRPPSSLSERIQARADRAFVTTIGEKQ